MFEAGVWVWVLVKVQQNKCTGELDLEHASFVLPDFTESCNRWYGTLVELDYRTEMQQIYLEILYLYKLVEYTQS